MNVFASLEEILSPVGTPEAPVIGLMVDDFDENARAAGIQIVDMGYAVQVLDKGHEYSAEDLKGYEGVYWYGDGDGTQIPVLHVDQGRVIIKDNGVERELPRLGIR